MTVQKAADCLGGTPINQARQWGLGRKWRQLRFGMAFEQCTVKHWVDFEGHMKAETVGDGVDLVNDRKWPDEFGNEFSAVSVEFEVLSGEPD